MRPITGWTELTGARTGKNLFNPLSTDNEWVNVQNIISTRAAAKSCRFPAFEGMAFTLSNVNTASATNILLIAYLDSNNNVLSRAVVSQTNSYITSIAPIGTVQGLASFFTWSDSVNQQLEIGSVKTEYTPYGNIDTISVSWATEAGIVYGGTLDVITGVLTVDRNVVQIPTDYWSYDSNLALFWSRKNNNPVLANLADPIVGGYDVVCSAYKHFNGTRYANIVDGEFSVGLANYSAQEPFIILKDTRFTTIEDFRTNSGIENVSFEIPLATPQTYQLSPNEIYTLDGVNNVYTDTGDVSVTYIAKSAKFSFGSPLHTYNHANLKLFGNTYIEHGKG